MVLEAIGPQTSSAELSTPEIPTYGLTDLGYKIFLDRYAHKDMNRNNLDIGQVVIVVLNGDDDMQSKREVGVITDIDHKKDKVTVVTKFGDEYTVRRELIDRPMEITPQEMHKRIAKGVASVEKKSVRKEWRKRFEHLLDDWKFVPGGRIMAMAGTDQDLTCFNCYVLPSPHDSRGGIMRALRDMTEIMSHGGGVGINVSTLRPNRSYVKGVNGRSSGSVSWAGLYSYTTGLVEQAGSRRGALMLMLSDWHPDIFDFIKSKREAGKVVNANISVIISDKFMDAVKADESWDLKFPETSYEKYDEEWRGDIHEWEEKGYPITVYKTVKARDIWNQIIESAHASAEPGVWFGERMNKMSNSYYYPEGKLIATNPCGEQGLSGNAVCNLGAINLDRFAKKDFSLAGLDNVDWDNLRSTIQDSVRFLDNIIDHTPYFDERYETQQKSERRVGLGVMGLADLMIRCGVRYGSEEGVNFVRQLFHFLARQSYLASSTIAGEKGSFTHFDAEKIVESGFLEKMDKDVLQSIRENGLRNVTINTVAPTGSTGTLVGVSTGLEPYFGWEWYRQGRLGWHAEEAKIVQEWRDYDENPDGDLPDYFVTAMELTPVEHVNVMGAIQEWVDSSLSKTCNVPNDYTIEQTSELYMHMYDMGAKGGTIYRDGSRDEQVLHRKEDVDAKDIDNTEETGDGEGGDKIEKMLTEIAELKSSNLEIPKKLFVANRAQALTGITFYTQTPFGKAYITVNEDPENQPFEVFITIGKAGSDVMAQAEVLGRLISTTLQMMPYDHLRLSALEKLASQMLGVGGSRPWGFGPNRVLSFEDAVGRGLMKNYINPRQNPDEVTELPEPTEVGEVIFSGDTVYIAQEAESEVLAPPSFKYADVCPECGNKTLIRTEGCKKCHCGYSEC